MKIVRSGKGRIWEIDLLRGIAVIMMIVFHLLYDLNMFAGFSFLLFSGFWWLFARVTAGIFVFLVGVSLTLSYSRAKARLSSTDIVLKYARRGLFIFGLGMIITVLTWVMFGDRGAIWFGVLHLIGVSIILAIPFLRYRLPNLLLGLVFLAIGAWLATMAFPFPWLMPLGLRPVSFYTFDYLPIFPWFGVVLLGLFFGNLVYPDGKRRFAATTRNESPRAASLICFLGRHSLVLYLLHQPVLIGLVYLAVLF